MADGGSSLKNPSRRRLRISPQQDAEKHIRLKTDKEGLREVFVNSFKGRGVFASIPFSKGDFVVEYRGKLFTPDSRPVAETYSERAAAYLFDFQWKGKSWCLDASLEDQSLGRLVNDEHKNPNCKMRTVQLDGMPHLCLFAVQDIVPGDEVTYDYGHCDWPWRKQHISTSPVATSVDEDPNSSHQVPGPEEHVEPLSSDINKHISTSPVATSVDEDPNSSHQVPGPEEHVEPLSSDINKTSVDGDPNRRHQFQGPEEDVKTFYSDLNKSFQSRIAKLKQHHDRCSERFEASEDDRNAADRQQTLMLHQRVLLDQQLAQQDNNKEDTSTHSTDESIHTNYSDVEYIPDTQGSDSDDSISLSPNNTLQRARFPKLSPANKQCQVSSEEESSTEEDYPVRKKRLPFSPRKKKGWKVRPGKKRRLPFSPGNRQRRPFSPVNENSSTVSPQTKNSREEDSAVRAKRRLPFSPGKSQRRPLYPVNESSSTVSPQTKNSREEDSAVRAKRRLPFSPGKSQRRPLYPVNESSSTVSPQTKNSREEDSAVRAKRRLPFSPGKSQRRPLYPVNESSSTVSPRTKNSREEDSAVRAKRRLPFSPGKSQRRPLHPVNESSSTVSPEKEEKLIQVLCTANTQVRRVYDKRNYCIYCSKPTSKLARHLQTVHRNKAEVAKAFYYPKDSKERRVRLAILRNRGNFAHNTDVARNGTGHLVARYRTRESRHGQDFIHCVHCQGLYSKKTLWKHIKICPENTREDTPQAGRKRVRSLCALTTPVGLEISEGLQKILTHANYDEVSRVVQSDKCILQLGQYMFNKLKSKGNNNDDYIRQKMREVGRMVLEAQKVTSLKKVEEFFIPKNFPHVISAVKRAAGYDPNTNTYQTPSLALKLGHSLKKMSSIVESNAMMFGDHVTAEYAKRYRAIHDSRWEEFISSGALNTLKEAKWNMPQVLPFTQDVKLLNFHMENQQTVLERMLRISPTPENYAALAKVTLALAITFNRRRAGEVSRMLLTAFRSRNKSMLHEDLAICLTPFERKMCEFFTRVEIRGKRGRMVPVLLKPSMVTAMELLADTRESCGVPSENLFMFARPEALSSYRGGECLQKYAKLCGAKHPEALTSTKLRKHIATMSQVLNLEENESDQLADFLGHDIRVHRQYYRLPQGTLQLARMSKVLLAMERGTVSQYKGMTLDDIEVDPEEKVPHSIEEGDASSDASSEEEECTSTDMDHTPPSTDRTASSEPPPAATPPVQEQAEKRRRKWDAGEVNAVEKHLMKFIRTFTVPGKHDCMVCLQSETQTLKDRTWTDVKNYVRNRITALKRQTST
ncbi:uncharacterized protein LOC110968623 isoform X9 [Acanthochromis polyacanthus]|uniref:uncharacterized protein LOC127533582 isoform X6 n=1 Tax=Acanthochromis polyacanthus TaxID=80966 RepID=UPI00223472C0|nr:uncharacterized protein LOC127533582 isoform X6 [Acanthochromis polyacanthus]XP_051802898.1 uncharacterized protein LOC127533582 isoform X7 [Acanthochromis polyacanthus]XP_051802901.1 uncharacterized protein LOC127533582 isoform X8 [Acanthochromis polyacanthus]XP_051802907.1 uncharacterized protein LOC127533582 isoform X9 [Acanthochromis polyacanthus]XP_051816334.1 uncharacterized protein LOC110968623 isoform X6 [Acanthochromis polyacanthus]XP_051816335.1 uncharacterized protein LOC11096862